MKKLAFTSIALLALACTTSLPADETKPSDLGVIDRAVLVELFTSQG